MTEAFKNDPNPQKINLGVGIYKDGQGKTPVLRSVKQAENRVLSAQQTKSYLPIDGLPAFNAATQTLLFGAGHEVIASRHAVTAQAPGGTGALRVAADFIAKIKPGTRVWISEPTWPDHPSIFRAAGLEVGIYPYFDTAANGINFTGMLAAIERIPEGEVLLLHGCCHNPTGVDLSANQWQQVADAVASRRLLALIDFAYQGFADSLREDAIGILTMAPPGQRIANCQLLLQEFWLV